MSFVLPTMSAERETEAQLSVEGFSDDSREFGIKPSNSLMMVFPKIGSVAISGMEPGPKNKFRVGEQVLFAAEGTDGAQFTWTFSDGVSKTMPKFARQFHEPGRYSFAVKAEKKPLASAQLKGEVEIIDAGALVKQVDAAIVAAKPAKFTAVVRGSPTGFDWFVNDVPVAGDGQEMTYVFPKSGTYEVQVRAHYGNVTPAVSPKLPVVVGVTPLVNIVHPIAGADDILINQDIDLQADVDGEFASVEWSIKGPESKNLTSPVDRKRALAVGKLQLLKPGEYEVVARAKGAQGAELVSEPLHMTVSLPPSGIAVDMSENGRRVPFGTQVRLVAKPFGAVKDVTWSVRVSGKEVARIPGETVAAPEQKPDGRTPDRTVEYLAQGRLADGSQVAAKQALTIIYSCPALNPKIAFTHADGTKSPEFSLVNDPVTLTLGEVSGRSVAKVVWDFGDGQRDDRGKVSVVHRFNAYGTYVVHATCVCPDCGCKYAAEIPSAEISVVRKPPVASFVLEPSKIAYGVLGVVRLIDKSTGDVKDRMWRDDGREIADSAGKTTVNLKLPWLPCDKTVSLTVTGVDDEVSAPCELQLRVRFGWWAVFLFFIVGIVVVWWICQVFGGNDVLRWIVTAAVYAESPQAGVDETGGVDWSVIVTRARNGKRTVFERMRFFRRFLLVLSLGKKCMIVKAGELLKVQGRTNLYGDFRFSASKQGIPEVKYDKDKFSCCTPSRLAGASPLSQRDDPHGKSRLFVFRRKDRNVDLPYVYMLVRTGKGRPFLSRFLQLILLTGVVVGVFWLCMRYAV